MIQYSFKNDYSEGCHANILQAMSATNVNQEEGYGEDAICNLAKESIYKKLGNSNADIHFVSGGTQANIIVISSILKSYESVIAADTGHISSHEAGAIETTGHKINTVQTDSGKLTPENIQNVLDHHATEHMVSPKLVFISNSTEVGSVYLKKELEELSFFCKNNNLLLYLDGARLGSALTSKYNDMTLAELSSLVDIFYIGGTKNGALLGEAIIINNNALKENFRFHLKQKGALLAKGRLLGIQFQELFRENLFFELGEHANAMAMKLADGIQSKGYSFSTEPVSNQIFPIFPNAVIEKMNKKYGFHIWEKRDNNFSVIRLVTSWATKEEFVDQFLADLEFQL